jgi:hypothetical protein
VAALVVCTSLVSAGVAAATTLKVHTTRDEALAGARQCSLREAIAAVDAPGSRTACGRASRGSNTIVLRAGRYVLSIPAAGPDDNASGDLDVTARAPLTIAGAGPRATVVDAGGLGDRVISVASTGRVMLRGLSITGGQLPAAGAGATGAGGVACAAGGIGAPGADAAEDGGGGILNSGSLVLDRVTVTGNRAAAGGAGGAGAGQSAGSGCGGGSGGQGASGGGVYNAGALTVTDSTIRGNTAGAGGAGGSGGASSAADGGSGGGGGAGGSGGGIYNQGRLSVSGSTVYKNRGGAGGVGGRGGTGIATRGADGAGGQGSAGGGIFSTGGRLLVENTTLAANAAGAGGAGGGGMGAGGNGGDGGALAVVTGASAIRNATVADDAVGTGGSSGGAAGAPGLGGGLFVQSATSADDLRLQNTIVASNVGAGCAGSAASAIADGGHDLSYGDRTCPGRHGNPKLGRLQDNGGATMTFALGAGSAAIDRVPRRGAGCPPTDQRGVGRPEGGACDIGAYEFALPTIAITSPVRGAFYERDSRLVARFRCEEGGIASAIATCRATVAAGRAIGTRRDGTERFVVTAVDKAGGRASQTVRYVVFEYVNPVRALSGLYSRRIDLGVDYGGWGPLLALGDGVVTMATDSDDGPSSCWAISCWPGGGIVVYRLLDGPFAGKYVYVAEHVSVTVSKGERVSAGQQIATLYSGYPWVEMGWAAGPGPEALGIADGHQCTCGDPGGWSTIDGRNFDDLLTRVGAPSGWLQGTPDQSMPRGWPTWSG